MSSFQQLIQGDTPVLVDFYADWCGPCRQMAPVLEQVKGQVGESVRIVKINVDKNQAAAQQFSVQSIPTMLLFRDGKVAWRHTGAIPAAQLRAVLQQHTGV